MTQLYCLDTSALINAWNKHYSPVVLPSIWAAVEALAAEQIAVSCRAVYKELAKQDDDLFAWSKKHRAMFEEPTASVTQQIREVMAAFPNIAAIGGTTNEADPWVVAHAKIRGAIVVTYEQRQNNIKPTKPPKMPNVCEAFDVPWTPMLDFLAANNVRI